MPSVHESLGGLSVVILGCVVLNAAACDEPKSPLEQAVDDAVERIEDTVQKLPAYDQELLLAGFEPSAVDGSVFRFDDRLGSAELRRPGSAARPGVAGSHPGSLPSFEFDESDPVPLVVAGKSHSPEHGTLAFKMEGGDYLITRRPLNLAKEEVGEIEVRLRMRRGKRFMIAWSGRHQHRWRWDSKEYDSVAVNVVEDGAFHTYRIAATGPLARDLRVGERIQTVVMVPSSAGADEVEIDFLRFIPKWRKYRAKPLGTAHESVAGELRKVIYAPGTSRLSYRVRVPRRSPRLRFGVGSLDKERPVRFQVRLREPGREGRVLVDGRTRERWVDHVVDLSRWQGQQLELSFEAETSRENVVFWSNPTLDVPPRKRFNILLVLEDALRAQNLSVYGYSRPTSPLKERLAKHGVVFEHAFAQAVKTWASLPSFMTSLTPGMTGVWRPFQYLDESYITLAEVLRRRGFATGSFVQNSNGGPATGLHQGFSYVFERSVIGRRPDARLSEHLFPWLTAHADRNFFVYLHLLDPHGGYRPDPPFDGWHRELVARRTGTPNGTEAPQSAPDSLEMAEQEALYDGEIRQNDAYLEGVIEHLTTLGVIDDTLIIFIADHGEHFGEHQRGEKPLIKHRWPAYTQVIRVPLIFSHRTRMNGARRVDEPVSLLDLMPTVLELAGVDSSKLPMLGQSLVGAMQDEAASPGARPILSTDPLLMPDGSRAMKGFSMVFDDLHLVEHESLPGPEVYDRASDPEELHPLATESELVTQAERLSRALMDVGPRVQRAIAGGEPASVPVDPQAQEQLRQLGYIE